MQAVNKQLAVWIDLYKFMLMSRESDLVEFELVNSGEANFLASSKGHEGGVILAPFLQPSDYLHCHYRDKALMLARGISSEMFFYSALAKAESHSYGRQMVSHMSAKEHNILSIVGPVGNNALQAVGVGYAIKDQTDKPLVLCAIGDGTSQQGEVLEAIAEAKRSNLPVLFFIHNNNLAISTRTEGKTFFSLPDGTNPDKFYDIEISYIDGTNPLESYTQIKSIISKIRNRRSPQIIVFNVDRLDNHSNADNQALYRSNQEISDGITTNDPILLSQKFLLANGVTQESLDIVSKAAIKSVRDAIIVARGGSEPKACFSAEAALPKDLMPISQEYRGDFSDSERLTMLEAMREVFNYQLANDSQVYLIGQDIEDGKGDVFGITKGLSTKYTGRVINSALTESTIVGVSCGMALTGMKPVAFIQFADFMPLAYNQIFTELATMYWRTNGSWQCPVIIFAACGGYRPGLGPFHSQTNEATYAHIPGIDVYMPSNAADAAGMLNAAFKSGRPSVYLYPKKLLNNGSNQDTTSKDIHKHIIPVGKARISKIGSDITLVGWGNTVSLCHEVGKSLESIGVDAEIIDLRTIKPYDVDTICKSVEKTKHLIVTHEDNYTCGVGADILASVFEKVECKVKAKRITRSDTYTPCNYTNQLEVLPSYERILTAACELLDIKLTWSVGEELDSTSYIIDVIGASPSDESVIINKLHFKVGDEVRANDVIVDIEASKSNGEILSPCDGVIEEIYVNELDKALVGSKLIKVKLANGKVMHKPQTKTPILEKHVATIHDEIGSKIQVKSGVYPVGMGVPHFKTGSLEVPNQEVLKKFPDSSSDDIFRRTGIQARYWLAPNETIIDIAVEAIDNALTAANLNLNDINMIICATCSPERFLSPATSCLILDRLYKTHGEHAIQSYDINAACSGYIYALQNAKDYLQTRPNERVLLVTAEALSKRMDLSDFDTAFLFGDGATATVLYGNDHIKQSKLSVEQIYLSAVAENGEILNIPVDEKAGIKLQGRPLFNFAVKTMAMVMHKCCQSANVNLPDIELVIPHQANQRIISAVESRLKLPEGALYSNIAKYGNTSSCTIPIALAETLGDTKVDTHVALCAFGAGFTSGAAILKVIS